MFACQIRGFRRAIHLHPSPELKEKLREIENYETTVRQFYCSPPLSTAGLQNAVAQPAAGLQSAVAQPTAGLQSSAKEPASASSARCRGCRKMGDSSQVSRGPANASSQVNGGLIKSSGGSAMPQLLSLPPSVSQTRGSR
ncbi:hypothetical protein AMECASPLE_023761 [Ameca splendens]|uniref:Uncharacterized protein n=1 Tax=Ameca splendens TaxID=208324 RepID=A0ABV0ZR77_9TELE